MLATERDLVARVLADQDNLRPEPGEHLGGRLRVAMDVELCKSVVASPEVNDMFPGASIAPPMMNALSKLSASPGPSRQVMPVCEGPRPLALCAPVQTRCRRST